MLPLSSILELLKQPSTSRGIIFLAAAVGFNVPPELAKDIVSVALGLLGIINVFINKN